jgi:hypothetical protein
LPFINDTEENLAGVLDYCIKAHVTGILCFGFGVTLREGNREYFYKRLDAFSPGMKHRYISTFGNRYECASPNEAKLTSLFEEKCRRHNILYRPSDVFHYIREFDAKIHQLTLF